jgi:hypothetical protein
MFNPLKNCDVVFLSYAEENKEVNWERVKSIVPKAKRVDGVKGFDAAHNAVGEIAETPYVILIDGDNWLCDDFVYDCLVHDDELSPTSVVNFGCINKINGLVYENGGVKIWPKDILLNLQSHENSIEENTKIDFCYSNRYSYNSNRAILSITDQATTPQQAFAGGFREAVKQSLNSGIKFNSPSDFMAFRGVKMKQEKLFALLNIGADVQNGKWSIYGARLAFWSIWFNKDFNFQIINDLGALHQMANAFGELTNLCDFVDELLTTDITESLFGFPLEKFTAQQSLYIKDTFMFLKGTAFGYV